jgi:hypothetical protein
MSGYDKDHLVRELHVRSRDVDGSPIDLATVKQRARRMRRRRNWVGGAAAVLVAAVTVPAALSVGIGPSIVEGPTVAGGPTTPVPTTSTSERPHGAPVRLTLDGPGRGEDPGIAYLDESDLVTPDGQRMTLDGRYSWITPYAQGWLAGSLDDKGPRLNFLDAGGKVLLGQPGSDTVVNASGSQVAYVTAAESTNGATELVFAPADGSVSAKDRVPVEAGATPVGFLSDEAAVYTTDGEQPEVLVATHAGSEKVPGLVGGIGTSATEHGLIAGATEARDGGNCSAVIRADGFDPLWDTCDFSFEQFSPDGRYLLGTDAYRDGIGPGTLAILDARSGDVVAHYQKRGQDTVHIHSMAWEDDSHVLATVYQDGEWAIVRMDTRGNIELATDLVPGSDSECPLFLSLRP